MKKVMVSIVVILLLGVIVAFQNRDLIEVTSQMSEMKQSPKFQKAWKHYEAGGGVKIGQELDRAEMEKAYNLFIEIAIEQPKNPMPLNDAGKALVYLSQYDEALVIFRESLERKENFTAHYKMAFIYMKKRNYESMVHSLRNAVEIEGRLDSVVRFSSEFADVRDIPEMSEFQDQYTK